VIAEVALSIVLLAGALLMVQSFIRVQKLRFGFETEHVLSGRVLLAAYRYSDNDRVAGFASELLPKLEAIPGVHSAGLVNYLPLSGWYGPVQFSIQGRPPEAGARIPSADFQIASEDYFRTMGIRLLAGRAFTDRDDDRAAWVVVASESLANRYAAVTGQTVKTGKLEGYQEPWIESLSWAPSALLVELPTYSKITPDYARKHLQAVWEVSR